MKTYSADKKRRNGIILISSVVFLVIIAFTVLSLCSRRGNAAVVTVNGKEVQRIELSIDKEYVFDYNGAQNTVIVKNGEIYMSVANCPDKLCILQGRISKTGQSIICLPHRFAIHIEE